MANGLSPIESLEAALRGLSLRQGVIANNVANLNTPGFRRAEVRFREALAKAMESGDLGALHRLRAKIVQPLTTPVDANGNDVNLDLEVGELVKNSAMYKTYMRLMAKLYRQMEMAMNTQT